MGVTRWAISIAGGLVAGYLAVQNLAGPVQPPANAVRVIPSAAPALETSTAVPFTPPATVRDAELDAVPFAAAGAWGSQPTPQPSSPAGRLTILLLGIDQRPDQATPKGDPGRTDSMVLVSIDYDAHRASLVSIPRDGFVVIPDHGNERVNAAYPFGEIDQRGSGPALAKRTVAQLFGVPVDRYALVDIHSMEQVIDTLGGVWIDNPYRLVDNEFPTDSILRTSTIDIPAGRQLMNGVTAVEYSRTRHPDSDYGRQARQQQVLLALCDQALQLNVLPRLPQVMPQLLDLVRTDLQPMEIMQVANFGRNLNRATDIITLPPNPELTPGYTGPAGASYINLSPAFRDAVRTMVLQSRDE